MSSETIECGHAKCRCHVTAIAEVNAFCCDYCRESELTEEEEGTCACGHPPCDVP
ncbi:MAG TPA: metallothionein [Candidatus Dormibacteraeota bacterium]|nr:metallothionein [Candidatus Dormibacteraeota bacterium]